MIEISSTLVSRRDLGHERLLEDYEQNFRLIMKDGLVYKNSLNE